MIFMTSYCATGKFDERKGLLFLILLNCVFQLSRCGH